MRPRRPDTLVLSVILIVVVGGLAGLTGIVAATVLGLRARLSVSRKAVVGLALGVISLAGAISIFLVAGSEPGTWFQ